MHVLAIDDDPQVLSLISSLLREKGHEVSTEDHGKKALSRIQKEQFDIICTDLKMPGLDGLSLVRQSISQNPDTPIILITGHGSTGTAIEAIQAGAFDYISKPFAIGEFESIVTAAEDVVNQNRRKNQGRQSAPAKIATGKELIIGRSKVMENVYKSIGKISSTATSVLVTGETGTGKELVARAIHQYSPRAQHPLVIVNCGAIPETLLESEMFGHERGAFTSADQRRIGRLQQADKGTIFLDEIGDISAGTQVKLLRFLQEKTIEMVGSNQTHHLDVRVIAATHKDLIREVEEGRFREDLFYRLNVARIHLPPLREREGDILLLADFFRQHLQAEFPQRELAWNSAAADFFQNYPWPGNIRQLENLIRQLYIEGHRNIITPDHLQNLIRATPLPGSRQQENHESLLRKAVECWTRELQTGDEANLVRDFNAMAEKILFGHIINLTNGHQTKAAQLLGVSMKTLRDKLKSYNLHPKSNP